jgi:hypothetical protein
MSEDFNCGMIMVWTLPFIITSMTTLIHIVIGFFSLVFIVLIYAAITSRLNQKPKCDHKWEDMDDTNIFCSKCGKKIQLQCNLKIEEHEIAA